MRGGCAAFLGVPYAAPPVGTLRFTAPKKHEGWKRLFEANGRPVACCQRRSEPGDFYYKEFHSSEAGVVEYSEDCLRLDVWTPAESAGEGLPVAM